MHGRLFTDRLEEEKMCAISNLGSEEDFAAFIVVQHRKWLEVAKSAHSVIDEPDAVTRGT